MLNAEKIVDALAMISDELIISAADFLHGQEEAIVKQRIRKAKIIKTVLIAALLVSLLTACAFVTGLFSLSHRKAEPEETFSYYWADTDSIKEWKDAKLVLNFEGPSECSKVELKPGWLPFGPYDSDNWYPNLEVWSMDEEDIPEEYRNAAIRYRVDVYYSAQFAEGGNAILLYQTPGDITEYEINGHKAMKFSAAQTINDVEYSFNFVILFNEDLGYMAVVTGDYDMAVIEKIAENLEFRTTEETVSYDDFTSHNVFFDGGNG